jgi:hypothetical protein
MSYVTAEAPKTHHHAGIGISAQGKHRTPRPAKSAAFKCAEAEPFPLIDPK